MVNFPHIAGDAATIAVLGNHDSSIIRSNRYYVEEALAVFIKIEEWYTEHCSFLHCTLIYVSRIREKSVGAQSIRTKFL